ncbi:DinB family protein [Blastococcus sp. TF02A-30]|uniref:DinB family protein n=1 Tax=Blastococcus sp. TF02A-30 TaxID=2250580 RepID=UPI0018F465DF|nr:DinB family protein [Blastococcus sp. TF02A-30]
MSRSGVRTDPPSCGAELLQLTAFLDYQRETVLQKAEGLSDEQLARALPTSSLTLGALLNHLARTEDSWMRVRFAGEEPDPLWADLEPEAEFAAAATVPGNELRRRYRAACAASQEVARSAPSLGQRSERPRGDDQYFDLRWVLLHLLEETARHAGHADLLREAVDGTVGE